MVLVCAHGLVDWLSDSPAGGVLAVAEGGDLGDCLSGSPVGVALAASGAFHPKSGICLIGMQCFSSLMPSSLSSLYSSAIFHI